jgi:hypothetical protein
MTECPKCKSSKVASGHLAVAGHSGQIFAGLSFVPADLKWYQFSLEGGATLKPEVFACPDCGTVWMTVAYPENLREVLKRSTESQ